jgi:hypothetical protein
VAATVSASVQAMPQAKRHVRQTNKGVTFIPESEPHESCSDSEDDIPVATLLKPKRVCNLTFQQIQDCRGEREHKEKGQWE